MFKYKKDVRVEAMEWYYSLTEEEKDKIENDYFDENQTGETTDIDIEAMYSTYKKV